MTVALVLAGDAGAGLCGQLAALGVRRVDVADRTGPGLLTVAAAARGAGERVLICVGEDAVTEEILARLLGAGGTAAFTGVNADAGGALVVDPPDLDALALAAESLAATDAAPAAASALVSELTRRGVSVRVLDAGPNSEGAVTQLIVDPAARDVARWAAGRKLRPAALYGISLGLGVIAAVWFSELAWQAKLLASVALIASFIAGRAGALLAATSREGRARPAVDWLGAASGLLTEFGVYAALAVSSALASPRPGSPRRAGRDLRPGAAEHLCRQLGRPRQAGVWRLAIAAMTVLAIRRMAELGFEHTARGAVEPVPPGGAAHGRASRDPADRRTIRGDRADRHLLRAAGDVLAAAGLGHGGGGIRHRRAAGPLGDLDSGGQRTRAGPRTRAGQRAGGLPRRRRRGPLARRPGAGPASPLPPVLVGLFVTCVLAALGLGNLPGILVLTPVEAMLLAALGARHPHDGRLDWLVPALLLAAECVFLAALGFSHRVPAAVVFALLAAVIMRHVDVAYRARCGRGLAADRFGFGWDGRMLLAGLAAVFGIAPVAYAIISGYLWLLFGWDYLSGWLLPVVGDS